MPVRKTSTTAYGARKRKTSAQARKIALAKKLKKEANQKATDKRQRTQNRKG